MRNAVACVSCRSAKQKCIHEDGRPPCDRCKQSGRAEKCEFPGPGTSALHRKPKRPRPSEGAGDTPPSHTTSISSTTAIATGIGSLARRDTHLPTHGSNAAHAAQGSPSAASSLLEGLNPFDLMTDEVIKSYLSCSYKWCFTEPRNLLLRIRNRTLEPWMAWAILALAIRFVRDPPVPFKSQTEASNAYAAHARQMLQPDLETPSLSRVQALLMLTGHDWGAGNGRRAWIYLGLAIRLLETMELTREVGVLRNRVPTREEFVDAEVRRRTAWTCFLMDSLLSGGKGRKRSLTAADMCIQLPCERETFAFGDPVCTPQLDGTLRMPPVTLPVGEIGIIGYSMRAANIWGKVARWSCSDNIKTEQPWSSSSPFQQLIYDLEAWKASLPQRLQYDWSTLHSHNAVDQGQAYCYMHCIYFMSYMFLHRAYLPVLGPQQDGTVGDEAPDSYHEHKQMWKTWEKTSRRELFRASATVLDMLDEMRTFGVYFLRGLVPWIGFTIYTAVGAMLYSFHFPSIEDDPQWQEKARKSIIKGCNFLKEMRTQWPMAETWFETIKRMQVYYGSVLGQDESPVPPEERQALRRAMVDYGALQPSPVHRPVESSKTNDAASPSQSFSDRKSITASITNPSVVSPPAAEPPSNSYSTTFTWNSPPIIPHLETDDSFNLDSFNLSNEELEAMMMTATQDFWASFPGEVGVSY